MDGLYFALAVSLALTLLLEAGFFFLTGKRDRKDLLLLLLANVLTNPVVVLVFWLTLWQPGKIPLELSAVLAEGFLYQKYGRAFKRPYLFSLAANAFSYGAGVLIQRLI
ncbi:MAG: hypothetical protein LBI19_00220 [Oscillospiraceae bacterium]|jgi:hypothetical protein|nr:hypothetical protein [Oscillospiraceae bacterium]